ncbi:biotin/lipoate--protein ligase family protein [Breoghania sp.]|uniref:biotin/lipoate--protein ligase family protein n=1 Tax=Breoghania sp. TaxID=2065378 RepID=UPI002AABD789|nr:biotin/lipoate--protein ligase family protein [Breoghania sp.]
MMSSSALCLPPLLTAHAAVSATSPEEAARLGAEAGHYGAGDLVWQATAEGVAMALVLEPEVTPELCRQMLLVGMVAAADAIGALIPPEVGITWDWPSTLRANDGIVGHVSLEMSETFDGAGAPDWLVLGLRVALHANVGEGVEPGLTPDRTTLYDEGCGEIAAEDLISAWARHLLTWIDTWQQDGFAPVREAWTFRARGREDGEAEIERDGTLYRGRVRGLDDRGGLLLEGDAGSVLLEL